MSLSFERPIESLFSAPLTILIDRQRLTRNHPSQRSRHVTVRLAVAAVALATPALSAAPMYPDDAKGALPYPARAPIVVCLNGIEKPRERITKLLATALPDQAPKLTKRFDAELDKLLEGRKLTAIRKDARLFLVVNDLAALFGDDALPIAVLVPVASYKDFRESFLTREELKSLDRGRDGVDAIKTEAFGDQEPAYMVDLKEYVAITLNRATAETYAGKFTNGTADQMGAELADSFMKADIALYVNMDAINEQFGDQIRGFKGLIDFGLQQAVQQGALTSLSKKQMEALKVLFKGAFQGVEDCRSIVIAAEIRPDGLAVRLHARFAENSASAKLISMETPSTLAGVEKLPTGLGLYGGMKFGKTISDALRDISQDLSTTEEDVQGTKLIEGLTKDLAAAGHQGDFSATSTPGVSLTISQYKEPQKAARALTKTYKAVAAGGRVNSIILKSAPRVSEEAQSLGGFTFSEVLLKYDFEATVAGLPDPVKDSTLQALKRTANETTMMWIGTDGKVVVQVTAPDWNAAKELLEKCQDQKRSVGADAGFKVTRAQLPAESNYLIIAETGAALSMLLESLRSTGEALPGFPKIPIIKPAKGEPTYVGLAVTLKGDTASVHAFVPTGAVAVGGKLLEPLFKKIE